MQSTAVVTGQEDDADDGACCAARTTMSVQFGGIERTLLRVTPMSAMPAGLASSAMRVSSRQASLTAFRNAGPDVAATWAQVASRETVICIYWRSLGLKLFCNSERLCSSGW